MPCDGGSAYKATMCLRGALHRAAFLALAMFLGAASTKAQPPPGTPNYPFPEGCPNRTKARTFCPRFFRRTESGSPWLPFDNSKTISCQSTCPSSNAGLLEAVAQPNKQYRLDEPQEIPCISKTSTCFKSAVSQLLECREGLDLLGNSKSLQLLRWTQMIPGSPTACGHGNREFSFFVRPADRGVSPNIEASFEKLLLIFAAGGICWDAESCGLMQSRLMGSGNNPWSSPSMRSPAVPERLLGYVHQMQTSPVEPGLLDLSKYRQYDVVIIPDCTGDMTVGNRSYTYKDSQSCITAHHYGGINTGEALKWILHPQNSKRLREILIVTTGYNDMGTAKAFGAHGPAFWAKYIQKRKPDARVRIVNEQSLGIYGPEWGKVMKDDPWGTQQLFEPGSNDWLTWQNWSATGPLTPLLPPPSMWSIAKDDMTSFYSYLVKTMPSIAIADVSSVNDPSQMFFFTKLGGKMQQCCRDGCSCTSGEEEEIHTGQLDFLKNLKVTILQRHQRLGRNYLSWLTRAPIRYLFLTANPEIQEHLTNIGQNIKWANQLSLSLLCPRVRGTTTCPTGASPKPGESSDMYMVNSDYKPTVLDQFIQLVGMARIELGEVGQVLSDTLPGRDYAERVFGDYTCTGCLDGIPGSQVPNASDRCNNTFGAGETLFTVARKYKTDWMLLWSLNGGDAPDTVSEVGKPYRFAHQYVMQEGETLESVAALLAVAPEDIMALNRNRMTHFSNPATLRAGDVICVLPALADVRDNFGNFICPADIKHVGEPYITKPPRPRPEFPQRKR